MMLLNVPGIDVISICRSCVFKVVHQCRQQNSEHLEVGQPQLQYQRVNIITRHTAYCSGVARIVNQGARRAFSRNEEEITEIYT